MPWYVRNKYVLTVVAFTLWMAFFDQYNMVEQFALKRELMRLENDRDYYLAEIVKTKSDLEQLLSDNKKLEKFAREKYFMKKPGEEIFIFVAEE